MVLSRILSEGRLQKDERCKFKLRAIVPYISFMMLALMEHDCKVGPDWTERIHFQIQ